jgi:hypothetical protein
MELQLLHIVLIRTTTLIEQLETGQSEEAIHVRLHRRLEIYYSIALCSCSLRRAGVICFVDLYRETKTIDEDTDTLSDLSD